jgi:hypothetical protein
MNVSKRTWIIFGCAIIALLMAFGSLYLEKEEEIKTLESIEPEPAKQPRVRKLTKEEESQPINVTLTDNEDGNKTVI